MEHTHLPAGGIVVGTDGSPGSDLALAWAAEQAQVEHRPLVILHSVPPLRMSQAGWLGASGVEQGRADDELRDAGRSLLARAVDQARHLARGVEVHHVLDASDARVALLAQSRVAAMLVVGSRGRGPVASLLLGSVSVAVSRHAECPVVVVRPDRMETIGQGVAVAVHGTPDDRPVVEFAYGIASQRSLPLTVLHCFWDAAHLDGKEREVPEDEAGLDDLRLLLTDAVKDSRAKYIDVVDRLLLVRDFPDRALIRSSRTMNLVVAGSRRRSVLRDVVDGSLTPTVIEHAHCPVAVVPTTLAE